MLGAVAPSCITMFVTFSQTPKGVDRDNKSPSPHGQTTRLPSNISVSKGIRLTTPIHLPR